MSADDEFNKAWAENWTPTSERDTRQPPVDAEFSAAWDEFQEQEDTTPATDGEDRYFRVKVTGSSEATLYRTDASATEAQIKRDLSRVYGGGRIDRIERVQPQPGDAERAKPLLLHAVSYWDEDEDPFVGHPGKV